MRIARWMGAVLVTAGAIGCGSASDPAPEVGANAQSAPSGLASTESKSLQPPAGAATPDGVVACFYEALRQGDDAAISSLLTDRAREETARNGLGVQSQASSGLEYQICETEIVTPTQDGAHVRSLWNERDESGTLVSTEVIWVLRRQGDGWRISGMATPVVEGAPPLLFNFEDPQDMLAKKDLIESQMTTVPQDGGEASGVEPVVTAAAPDRGEVRVAQPLAIPLEAAGERR